MAGLIQLARFLYILSRTVALLPVWLVVYTIPAARPRRRWSYGRAILMQFMHYLFSNGLVQRHVDILLPSLPTGHEDLLRPENVGRPSKRKDGLVSIPPVPAARVGKELLDIAEHNSVSVGTEPVFGFWHGTRSADGEVGHLAAEGERVICNIHGGGWFMETGSAKSVGGAWIHRILESSPSVHRAFNVEFRLASIRTDPVSPSRNPFPAALIDALSGYIYLLSLGFTPDNIILTGESVGGNMALTLARLLPALDLPMPGRVIVLSPAVDPGLTWSGPGSSAQLNKSSDYGQAFFTSQIMVDAVRGAALSREDARTSMWISAGGRNVPASQHAGWFAALRQTQTLIFVGGAEVGLDGVRTVRQRILEDLGKEGRERLVYVEEEDAPHNYASLAGVWDPEGANAIKRAVQFIED